MSMPFDFCILGSGSAGNSALIRAGGVSLLLDAGLSAKQLRLRLEAVGASPDSLDGILLTHEHGDHTRGLNVFLKRCRVPVYCNIRTRQVLDPVPPGVEWKLFEAGDRFEVGPLTVESFYVPHDAVEPMGYVFRLGSRSLGVLSDVGHVTTLVREQLQGMNALFVEANYDDQMLQNDTKRPWSTKQRIASRHGHLSNAQTRDLVREVAHDGLSLVVLGHLSQDCNAPEVAVAEVANGLAGIDRPGVEVACAAPEEVTPFFPVGEAVAEPAARLEPEPAPASAPVPAGPRARPAPARRPVSPWKAADQFLF